jgi:hypothetical protein
MANEKNLIPASAENGHKLTAEEQSKGGKASGEVRRRKREMRDRLELLLSMPINSGKGAEIEKIKSFGAIKGKNITVEDAILIAITQKAMKGDISAGTFIRDTVGEKPTENKNVTIMDTDWFTE